MLERGISVIVPLADDEPHWQNLALDLIRDLVQLPRNTQIVWVVSTHSTLKQAIQQSHRHLSHNVQMDIQIITSQKSGRAAQMNAGAKVATHSHLWFLHADSRFGDNTARALFEALQNHPADLLYFELAFWNAPVLMHLNAWGGNLRSRIFKTPFGDQGFCIPRARFWQIGSFNETLSCGEDHQLVWQARQHGIALHKIGAKLYTSARKYQQYGWLKTTLTHQYLWIQQALPEWHKLRRTLKQTRKSKSK